MEAIFLKILNMSITATWLVLAVVVVRLLLKKAPKFISVLLWAIVGIRLICPFSFESVLSLIPSAETVPPSIIYSDTPAIESGVPIINNTINQVITENLAPTPEASVSPMQIITLVASVVWLVGIIAMVSYTVFSYLRIKRKVKEALLFKDNILLCDRIDTPFILGVLRPKIYLPSNIDKADMEYVIAHEKAHIKRRDHLWKPLGFLILAVYWFNPALWLGYILLCKDIEFACDQKVLKQMGSEIKKPYSNALINCSVPRKMISACPLAFGEVGVKGRIKSVLNYKKPAFWIVIVAIVTSIAVAVCFLTNPKKKLNNTGNNSTGSNNPNNNNSSNAVYIETDPDASAKHKVAISAYNKFLSGEITARRSDGTSYNVLQYGIHGDGIANFALGDVNNDNIPELFIHADHYAILSLNGNYLAEWYNSMSWQAICLLQNGAVLDTHSSVGVTYKYITFNANGIEKFVSFSKPAEGESNQIFYFGENGVSKEVSKAEWDQLTNPYFEQAKKTVELKWTKWEKKNNTAPNTSSAISQPQKEDLSKFSSWYSEGTDSGLSLSSIAALKERFPHYFNVSTKGGITVCIWQTSENDYRCFLMNSDSAAKSDQTFAYTSGTTIAETRAILSTYDIDKSDITVTPVKNPLSSYSYKIDNKYKEKVTKEFWKSDNLLYTMTPGVYVPISIEEMKEMALNTDKLGTNQDPYHLPVYKLDSLKALDDFKKSLNSETSAGKVEYANLSDFDDAIKSVDGEFFKTHSLIVIYHTSGSGSYRYDVHSIEYTDKSFKIHVVNTYMPGLDVTCDVKDWFITLAVPKTLIKNCNEFDADLNNVIVKPNINELKLKYPTYLNLYTKGGLDVYLWFTTREHVYGGILPTRLSGYTDTELESLAQSSASIDELRAILGYYVANGYIAKDKVKVKLISLSHTEFDYTDESARQYLEELLWSDHKFAAS